MDPTATVPGVGRAAEQFAAQDFASRDHLAEPLFAGRLFSAVELAAMAGDGIVRRLYGNAYISVAETPCVHLRAAALAGQLPAGLVPRAVVGRTAAAWVYGCAPPPERIELLVSSAHRTTALPPSSGCSLHEVTLGAYDDVRIAGARVTTALRTAVDVAHHVPEAQAMEILRTISRTQALNCPLGLIRAGIDAGFHVPRKVRALALVDALLAEPLDC